MSHATHAFDSELTPAQAEALEKLAEELCEAAAICMKTLRHGPCGRHPDGTDPTNAKLLTGELGDVLAALALVELRSIGPTLYDALKAAERSLPRLVQYLHYDAPLASVLARTLHDVHPPSLSHPLATLPCDVKLTGRCREPVMREVTLHAGSQTAELIELLDNWDRADDTGFEA